jgi:hypothetical protein
MRTVNERITTDAGVGSFSAMGAVAEFEVRSW